MATCRTNDVNEAVNNLKNMIIELKSNYDSINLYNPILQKVEEKYNQFGRNSNNVYGIILWCAENGLIQQSFLL